MKSLKQCIPRFGRYSIRLLFGVTFFVACSLGIWQAFFYEPPIHKFPLYEKAPWSRGLDAKIGPNTITLRSVARNDRDGSLRVESGKGDPLVRSVPNSDAMVSSADWLDVAQFELTADPGSFEIIEARVFDHTSRTLLSTLDPAFGWQVIRPNLVQVYGLEKKVPPLLDLWLRVHSYHAGDLAYTTPPHEGAKLALPGGDVTLREVQRGFAGWSSRRGFWPVEGESDATTALVLEWDEFDEAEWYQIAALSKHGEKQLAGGSFYLSDTGERQHLSLFDFPLDEINSIEMRLHRGRHRFFFEAVELPKVREQSFSPPPTKRVPVNGAETETVLSELAPLRVRLALTKGDAVAGSFSNGLISRIMMRPEPREPDNILTLTFNVTGISELPIAVRFQDSQTGQFGTTSKIGTGNRSGASGATNKVSASVFPTPLDRVEAVEVSVSTGP